MKPHLILITLILSLLLVGCHSVSDGREAQMKSHVARQSAEPTRRFHIRYEASVKGVPTDKTLRLWIPVPSDDAQQKISNMMVRGQQDELSFLYTREKKFGNRFLFIEGTPSRSDFTVTVEYDVARYEYRIDRKAFANAEKLTGEDRSLYLKPSRLVVINDRIKKLSDELTRGKAGDLAKAGALYDHIIAEMSYGKPKDKPWGRGDTMFACDARIGNCTDFHSYFISLCRASGIPARFQIGLFGKYGEKIPAEYKTGSYHCWAEFYVAGKGWVPVDISEADKLVDKQAAEAGIYFGFHTDNRVTLSMGRDLVLEPAQEGAPLNYIVHPYAEVDGEPHRVAKQGFWKDAK